MFGRGRDGFLKVGLEFCESLRGGCVDQIQREIVEARGSGRGEGATGFVDRVLASQSLKESGLETLDPE